MKIIVNGEAREISADATLRRLLDEMKADVKYVAVAVNMDFIPRTEYEGVLLKAGDDVEIVSPQAGG